MACITLLSTWLLHIQIFRPFPFAILSFYRSLSFPLSFSTFFSFSSCLINSYPTCFHTLVVYFSSSDDSTLMDVFVAKQFSLYITKSCFPGLGHLVNCLNFPFCSSFYALPFHSVLSLFFCLSSFQQQKSREKYKKKCFIY